MIVLPQKGQPMRLTLWWVWILLLWNLGRKR